MFANLLITKFVHLCNQSVEEIAVVAYHNQRSVVVDKCLFQNVFRLQVEVVRWLVKDEQINRLEQKFEDCQSRALASRKNPYGLIEIIVRLPKAPSPSSH